MKIGEFDASTKIVFDRARVYGQRILRCIKQECRLLMTAILAQTGAERLYIENLQLSVRGKSGSVPKAILNMPDEINIFEQAVRLPSTYREVEA